jgi:PTS system mannose-specific IID component
MRLGLLARSRLLLRSHAIQGSWNYRTLIGHGFAFALLPVLRGLYRGDPVGLRQAIARHRGIFNSHPYLVGVALGAVARMEVERTDPDIVERFKTALRGPLGSLGDRLVWAGWRPLCLVACLALYYGGLHWLLVVFAFLAVYNLGHFVLRAWGFRIGLLHGREVGERLKRSRLAALQKASARAGAFGLGLLLPLLLASSADGLPRPWWLAAVAAALLGARFGNAIRRPLVIALVSFLAASLLLGRLGTA